MLRTLVYVLALLAPLGTAQADRLAPKHLTFEDDQVEGDLVRPDDRTIESRLRPRWQGLLRPRTSFIPELVQSADAR